MKIEIKGVTKIFNNEEVLKNINMTLNDGKIYGFIGKNGSGKSVLLKIICGFYKLSSGEVLINDVCYNKNDIYVPDLRALIEKPNFFDNLTGFENLKLLSDIQNTITDNDINSVLDDVNLSDVKDKKFHQYSLGMKQKLGIAQVLMEDSKILIFDEPFNGVDNESVGKIFKIIKEKKNNRIIIITSHYLDEINKLCDVIYEFDNGECKCI